MGQIIQTTNNANVSEETSVLIEEDQCELKDSISKSVTQHVKISNKAIEDKKYDKMFLRSDKARDTATWIMNTW